MELSRQIRDAKPVVKEKKQLEEISGLFNNADIEWSEQLRGVKNTKAPNKKKAHNEKQRADTELRRRTKDAEARDGQYTQKISSLRRS